MVSRLALSYLGSARSRREVLLEPERLSALHDLNSESPEDFTDALASAFEIVLSRLSPSERAVFLLREVFQFEYDEVAKLLGLNESNCRQMLSRARDKIALREPRFPVAPETRERVLEQFLVATRTGDFEQLLETVSPEVVLMRDAGDIGLPQPDALQGQSALIEHVRSFWNRFPAAIISASSIGRGYEIATLRFTGSQPFSAIISSLNDNKIKQVDHITCPTRLKVLLHLFQFE